MSHSLPTVDHARVTVDATYRRKQAFVTVGESHLAGMTAMYTRWRQQESDTDSGYRGMVRHGIASRVPEVAVNREGTWVLARCSTRRARGRRAG